MKVLFLCPHCQAPARTVLDAPKDWQCDACGHVLHLDRPAPELAECVVCGNHELYKQKDFPHWLGMNVLVVACAASFFTYFWYDKWLTWAILIGTAVFDGLLYALVGDALVCYRCNAHYKKFSASPAHQPFELTVGERYRQERIRREQMKTARDNLPVDDQQRSRIRDDLQGFFQGELQFDEVARILYSTDASIFQVKPLGVAAPRHEDDLCALVKYAYENRIPLVARGAGTGMAGESLGPGLIVDLSRHLREIVEVGADSVRVQPGVTLDALNRRLAETGRRFAPDPASGVCTLGGMLATNASGSHALKHGYTSDHVLSLRAILDNGDTATLASEPWPLSPSIPTGHFYDVLTALGVLLEQNETLIERTGPATRFDRCGYQLKRVLHKQRLNLPRLVVGSEGTLALFTEAKLRTIPLPGGQSLVLLGFASLELALRATKIVLEEQPAACELLDRRLLSVARSNMAAEAALVDPAAEAVLLVEFEAESPERALRMNFDLVERMSHGDRLALQVLPGLAEAQQERLWRLREVALPSLYGLKGSAQPAPFIEDVGVPVEALPEYLARVQAILQEAEVTASFLVHAGAGQVHARPFLDLQQPVEVAKLAPLAEQVHSLAIALGGTISTQHGTGLARTPWVARQFGELYPVLRQVKAIFDPRGIFNPGKIVDPDPSLPAWPLRAFGAREPEERKFRWTSLDVHSEANHCNGCGTCRSEVPGQRMCPIFRATQDEAATPRAKANLLRQLLQGNGNGNGLAIGADEVRAVADLCVNCKMCAVECPAHVNIPKLMLEAKANNVARHGLSRSGWFFSRLHRAAGWGSSMPLLFNLLLQSRPGRWIFSKLFGLASRRRLPRFARRTFLWHAERSGWTKKPETIKPLAALFVDLFTNHFDPSLGEAAVRVLQHQGFDVIVPPEQVSSGIEALAQGDLDTVRELAARNLRAFAELARQQVPIVCLEASAALMLRHEYAEFIDDVDARLVAEQTVEFSEFLDRLDQEGRLKTDFKPVESVIGYHIPCHLKALGRPIAGPRLLGKIPGLHVQTLDVSCSGMAGTFGLEQGNVELSRKAGEPMLAELRRPEVTSGAAECAGCRLQMQDGSGKRALHPAQWLALAYGLMPELAERLKKPLRPLVL